MLTPRPYPMFLLAAGALVACQQAVDLGDDGATRIVIDSQLEVGEPVRVNLRVVNSFGVPAEAEFLEETLGIISGSNGTVDTLAVYSPDKTSAILSARALDVEEGITYELELDAPGFATVTNVTTVPQPAGLTLPASSAQADVPRVDSAAVRVRVALADVAGSDTYFFLSVALAEAGEAPTYSPGAVTLVGGRRPVRSSSGSWVFDDREFVNDTLDAHFELDAARVAAFADPVAVIELRTLSRSYYAHLRSSLARGIELKAADLPTAAGDNAVGGVGLFGSYTTSVVRRALK